MGRLGIAGALVLSAMLAPAAVAAESSSPQPQAPVAFVAELEAGQVFVLRHRLKIVGELSDGHDTVRYGRPAVVDAGTLVRIRGGIRFAQSRAVTLDTLDGSLSGIARGAEIVAAIND